MKFRIMLNKKEVNRFPQLEIEIQLKGCSYFKEVIGLEFKAVNMKKALNRLSWLLLNNGVGSTNHKYFMIEMVD